MHISRRIFVAGALGAGIVKPHAALARMARSQTNLINTAVAAALDAHASPGVQVAIAHGGDIAFSRGYGLANIEAGTPVSERSVFRIGSLTKQFTSAAMIKLAATGRVQLNAPVARYLSFMETLPAMSLLELMHHTAGLHADESEESVPSAETHTQLELAQAIARQVAPSDFPPGTAWLYSNANYIVLGAVIEAVTNMMLSDALDEIVCGPLGLMATAMDRKNDIVLGRASGYTQAESGGFENAAFLDIAEAGGAGAMRSTARELCRWHTSLFAGRLFGQADVTLMVTPGRLRDGRLSGANRFSPDDASYGDVQYACGLLVSPSAEKRAALRIHQRLRCRVADVPRRQNHHGGALQR
jgi:D-alanyl-D-alanine carboxypeptidase